MSILHFDECALAIIMLFLCAMIVRKEYKSRTNLIMFILIWLIFACTNADLIAGSVSNRQTSVLACYIANYIYFFTHNLILPTYILYIYSSVDVWHIFSKQRKYHYIMFALIMVDTVVLAMNGWAIDVFSITPQVQYVRGVGIAVFYVVAAIYGIWVFLILVNYRRLINRDKLSVLLFLFIVIITSMLIQLIDGNYLVENFALALSVMFFMVIVKREESQINPLTGAFRYDEGIERVTRCFESGRPFALIFIKLLNDDNLHLYLGLEEYNAFLQYMTERLGSISHANMFSAEIFYMGNGLYALMGDSDDRSKVEAVAEQCSEEFRDECHFKEFTLLISTSIYVMYCPDDVSDFTTVLNLSTNFHDTMQDTRKVHYHKDMMKNMDFLVKNEMDEILHRAFEHSGFVMYYQPIFSVEQQKFVSVEAQLRLKDRVYGFIPPELYVPTAEADGHIFEVGNIAIENVFKFLETNDLDELGINYLELRLFDAQFNEADLADRILDRFEKIKVEPNRLGLQITETVSANELELMDNIVNKLHGKGIKIILTDYGTGYSNIRRVTRMPVDQIKLNKDFAELTNHADMWIVIQDIIKMLKEMGKEILIDGIDDPTVAANFVGMGIELLQGCDMRERFVCYEPMTKDELIAFLKAKNS